MTWDDVFKAYELRYGFLLRKLNVDRDALLNRLEVGEASRATADEIREQIIQLRGDIE
jgi:hypothetical protein